MLMVVMRMKIGFLKPRETIMLLKQEDIKEVQQHTRNQGWTTSLRKMKANPIMQCQDTGPCTPTSSVLLSVMSLWSWIWMKMSSLSWNKGKGRILQKRMHHIIALSLTMNMNQETLGFISKQAKDYNLSSIQSWGGRKVSAMSSSYKIQLLPMRCTFLRSKKQIL